MGGGESQMQRGTSIENNLIALIINRQTERVIDKLESDPDKNIIPEMVNFKGDNLLHYACATNNILLAQFFLKKCPRLASAQNSKSQYPHDLTTNDEVRELCKSKVSIQSMIA